MAEAGYTKQTLGRARSLRGAETPAEAKVWAMVRDRRMGLKFRRQQPLGSFIVDFFCAETGLVIELDGGTHAGAESYDARRTVWLEGQGYSVIRYLNSDVHDRPNDVKRGIGTAIEASLPHPGRQGATCPSPSRGEG